MALAAARMSSQVFGCQSVGRPALRNTRLSYQSPRVSVPSGTPYAFPSWPLGAAFAVSMNCPQSGHLAR
jgi:hypothetical protein